MDNKTLRRRCTITDIARLTGLSIASISRYLNGIAVRKDTEEKIEAVLRVVDYSPNLSARSMKGSRTGIIGLILPELSHSFFSLIAEGAISEARRNDQLLLISSTEGDPANEKIIMEQYARSIMDGLIYIPVSHPQNIPLIDDFRSMPLVVAGRCNVFPNVPHVYSDGEKGGYIATRYLIELGRRNIGFFGSFWDPPHATSEMEAISLSGEAGSYSTIARFKGYRKALAEAGIPYDSSKIVICGYGYDNGVEATRELLGKSISIDGLLVMTGVVAGGSMEVLKNQGLAVPEDISIIAFEDSEIINVTVPRLTSVQLSLRKMGMEAVRSLNGVLGKRPYGDTVMDVSLRIGESTRRKGASDHP